MKNKERRKEVCRKKRGAAFGLCFVLVFGLAFGGSTTFAAAVPVDGETADDAVAGQVVTDCTELSALVADTWEEDYFGSITLDTETGDVEIDGEEAESIDVSGETSSEAVLDQYLNALPEEEDLYSVEETEEGTYEITAPFQTKRLILEEASVDETYGAAEIYYNTEMGETILQFDSAETTQEAYETLCETYGDENCTPDTVYDIDDLLLDGVEPVSVQATSYSWGNTYMGMSQIKSRAQGRYSGITVAILDTGIDKSSSFFSSRKITKTSYNFMNNSKDVTDYHGHGTHVAGIIADATPTNVRIMMLKIANSSGYTSMLTIKTALQYAVDHNVAVINMSVGFIGYEAVSCTDLGSLINKAYKRGIPICAAAGNSAVNVNLCYPARNEKTIAVSSIDDTGTFSTFSDYGSRIDFCAPGEDIVSAGLGGGVSTMSGTSMSAPHMTAAVAYLKMMQTNLSVQGVYKELKSRSVDLGPSGKDSYYGWGCPNLETLLDTGIIYTTDIVSNSIDSPVLRSVKNTQNGIQIRWKKVGKAKKYRLYRKEGSGSYKKIKTLSAGKTSYLDRNVKQGKEYTYTVKAVRNSKVSAGSNRKKTVRLKQPAKLRLVGKTGGRLVVKWKKQGKVSGYQIRYVTGKKNHKKKETITVTGSGRRVVLRGLQSHKTYKVKVRAWKKKGNQTFYSPWSVQKKEKVK